MTSTLKCRTLLRYIGLICQHIIELRLLGFKLVWLAARKWNQYNSHFTSKLDQLHKALYQDIETRFSHYCIVGGCCLICNIICYYIRYLKHVCGLVYLVIILSLHSIYYCEMADMAGHCARSVFSHILSQSHFYHHIELQC